MQRYYKKSCVLWKFHAALLRKSLLRKSIFPRKFGAICYIQNCSEVTYGCRDSEIYGSNHSYNRSTIVVQSLIKIAKIVCAVVCAPLLVCCFIASFSLCSSSFTLHAFSFPHDCFLTMSELCFDVRIACCASSHAPSVFIFPSCLSSSANAETHCHQ